ncbi:hypothetical protein CR513_23826, partial [Mucuna pruriens]
MNYTRRSFASKIISFGSEGSPQGGLSTIQMQALTSYLENLFDRKLEAINKHMDQIWNQIINRQATRNNSRRDEQSNERDESQFKEEDNEEEQPRRRMPSQNNQRKHRNRKEDDLGGIKIKVPSFQGKSNSEAYLEWGICVDQIFSCQSYLEGSKSVDDYHKEMEMIRIRANILEDQETTMTQFLNGLNCDIANNNSKKKVDGSHSKVMDSKKNQIEATPERTET